MNVSRRCLDGTTHPEEQLNKSQIYITTAGYKNTFAYDKLIQLLVQSIIYPDKAMIMGGTYRIPILVGLLDRDFVKDLKQDSTFNEMAFSREYESIWAGSVADAFFDPEMFDRNRVLKQPEYEYSGRSNKLGYYIIGYDVGRKGDNSVAVVIKVTPQAQGANIKTVVNMYSSTNEHFEDQAIFLKKLFYKYKARRLVIDGNGVGLGFIDYMIKSQVDPVTNDIIPK